MAPTPMPLFYISDGCIMYHRGSVNQYIRDKPSGKNGLVASSDGADLDENPDDENAGSDEDPIFPRTHFSDEA